MITLSDCVEICLSNEILVQEFDRLRGTSLGSPADGYEAAKLRQEELALFVTFVLECIWNRLPLTDIE